MSKPQFTWPGVEPDKVEHQVLHDFFVFDMQSNQRSLTEFLEQIKKVKQATSHDQDSEPYQFGGNMFVCTLAGTGATIDIMVDAPDFGEPKQYSLELIESAANAWQQHLSRL